jgi:hypothetical protein
MSAIPQLFCKFMWVRGERHKSMGAVKLGDGKTVFYDYFFPVLSQEIEAVSV